MIKQEQNIAVCHIDEGRVHHNILFIIILTCQWYRRTRVIDYYSICIYIIISIIMSVYCEVKKIKSYLYLTIFFYQIKL